MLGNCDEKMVLISPTTNEWPQNHHHQMASTGGATATARVMGKPLASQEQQQQQIQIQQALKCPRCDSSNTKFCYYNNYSLSQPRHFCKACKRYWTRGGTLRNVPVGGGCRKNKRIIKKPPPSNNSAAAAVTVASNIDTTTSSNPNGGGPQIIDMSPNMGSPNMGSMFYGLPSNNHHSDLNLPFRFNSSVSNGYDLGLGFSSSNEDFYRNGGLNLNKQIVQDIAITSNSFLSNYGSSMFGSNNSTSSSMASLLASTLHQQKFFNGGGGSRETTLFPFGENMQQEVVKVEDQGQNRYGGWSVQGNQIEAQIGSSGDPNSVYWNTSSNTNNNVVGAAWPDLANLGSSVTSLI